jgi:small subunit ribosomal protein S21
MTTTENPENNEADAQAPAAASEAAPVPPADAAAPSQAPQQREAASSPEDADGAAPPEADDAGDRRGRNRRAGGRGVRVDGNLEKAIRQFRKRIERQGLFRELRKRRFFEKPSERRKRKQREAEKRRRKKSRRD